MVEKSSPIRTLREAELDPGFNDSELPPDINRELLHPNRVTGYGLVMSYSGLVTWLTGRVTLNPILESAGLGLIGAGFCCDAADGRIARSHRLLQTKIGKSFDPLVDKLVNYPTQLVILISFLLILGFSATTITMALLTVLGTGLDTYSTKIRLKEGETLRGHVAECWEGFRNPKDTELNYEGSKQGSANALGKLKTIIYSVTNSVMMVLMTTAGNTSVTPDTTQGGAETIANIGALGYATAFACSIGSLIKKKLSKSD